MKKAKGVLGRLPPLRKELQKRRTGCIRVHMSPHGTCSICGNPRRKAAVYMVLEFALVSYKTEFVKGEIGKPWPSARDMRLGAGLCRPCAKRIVNRMEISLDQLEQWQAA